MTDEGVIDVRFKGIVIDGEPLSYDLFGSGHTVDEAWQDVCQQYVGRDLTYDDWSAA